MHVAPAPSRESYLKTEVDIIGLLMLNLFAANESSDLLNAKVRQLKNDSAGGERSDMQLHTHLMAGSNKQNKTKNPTIIEEVGNTNFFFFIFYYLYLGLVDGGEP